MATEELDVGFEYRTKTDDAWFGVTVEILNGGEKLKVTIPELEEEIIYRCSKFADSKGIWEFVTRFRPVSLQLQDSECSEIYDSLLVCASHKFDDDVLFHDALVDKVHRIGHSGRRNVCRCKFDLLWLHGANAGKVTTVDLGNICRVRYESEMNPALLSFVKEALKILNPGVVEPSTLKIPYGLTVAHHSEEVEKRIRWPVNPEHLTWIYALKESGPKEIDFSLGRHYRIGIENLEKDLTSSQVTNFMQNEMMVSTRAIILPSLSWEVSARGILFVYIRTKADKLSIQKLFVNRDKIVVSSNGRPWVITEARRAEEEPPASLEDFNIVLQVRFRFNINLNFIGKY